MKLSGADFTFPLLDHSLALDLIRGLGLQGVDIGVMGGRSHVRTEDVLTNPESTAERLRGLLCDRQLAVSDVFLIPHHDERTATTNHPDPEQRAMSERLFAAAVIFASTLGSDGITILPGHRFDGEPWADAFARSADGLQRRTELARQHGLGVSIEPHVGSLTPDPDAVESLIEAVPGLRVTLDLAHFVAQGVSPRRALDLVQHARHVHVRPAARDRVQVRFAENQIDFQALADQLRTAGYEAFCTLEYVWVDTPGLRELDTLSETIKLRDHLRACT